MRLTAAGKVFVGLATAWPFAYLIYFVLGFVSKVMRQGGSVSPSDLEDLIFLHLLTGVVTLLVLVFYIVHALRNERLDQSGRLLWVILFFVGSVLAMSVYYFLQVLPSPHGARDASGTAAADTASGSSPS